MLFRSVGLDPLVQGRLVVIREHVDRTLREDRTGVHPGVDEVHGAPGDGHAVGQRVAHPVRPRERREQRRVGVEHPPFVPGQERRAPERASASSQASRFPKSAGLTTTVATPAERAMSSPPASALSLITATTRAGWSGSAWAASNAARVDPVPETSTAIRADRGTVSGRGAAGWTSCVSGTA